MIQLRKLKVMFARKFTNVVLIFLIFIALVLGCKVLEYKERNIGTAVINMFINFELDDYYDLRPNPESFPTGSGNGKVTTDFGGLDEIASAALRPDGKIVVVGVSGAFGQSRTFTVVRYNPNGALDATFGSGGRVTTDFIGIPTQLSRHASTSLVIQPDGKIVVAGAVSAVVNEYNDFFTKYDFALARYNADGSLDATFGSGGKVITDVVANQSDAIGALALQPDGKIVAAGLSGNRTIRPKFALVRYNSNGSLDTTFGTGGKVVTSIANNNGEAAASSLIIQPDGKIVAGGSLFNLSASYSSYDFALARFDSNGNLDTGFGNGGTVTTDWGSSSGDPRDDLITSMVLQPDGKILAAGVGEPNRNTASSDFVIARYNSNGSLDTAFGAGGKVSTDFYGTAGMANSIALQSDGKFVVAGIANGIMDPSLDAIVTVKNVFQTNSPTASEFAVARYNPNGSLDSSFGTGGRGTTDFFGSVDAATKVLIRPDGRILVAGFAQTTPFLPLGYQDLSKTDFAIALYKGTILQRRKLNDFDGDGKAEFAVFRPSNSTWYIKNSFSNTFRVRSFGNTTDIPAAGDFDGDGLADIAVYRGGVWYFLQSSDDSFRVTQFGESGDRPVQDNYDGDGKTDIAIWRPSTGTWWILNSTGGYRAISFGQSGDIPVNGDYNGDGKSDVAVYRPSNGTWYSLTDTYNTTQFGTAEDKPAVGDYDGDGIFDFAVFRPSNGVWYFRKSRDGFSTAQWGVASDIPVPADYDGDQLTDIAIFRPSEGKWYVINSGGGAIYGLQYGQPGDIPVPAAP